MGLVNRAIPALIGGVSQQPAPVRHASQVDECVNMIPSVVTGLRSRAGTRYVNKLSTTQDWTDAFVHWFENERGMYALVINNASTLKVFDENGTEVPVTAPNGFGYLLLPSTVTNYIPARSSFKAVTVADYTFVVNQTIQPALDPLVPVTIPQRLYLVVKTGVIKTTYQVTLDGTTYSYTSGDASATPPGTDSGYIASQLAAAIGGSFSATTNGNLIIISKSGDANFTFSYSDTYGGQAMFGFSDTVNRYEDLPKQFVEGKVIKVQGDPNNANAVWYVEWKKDANNKDGVWVETVAPNLQNSIGEWSMPYTLIQQTDGSFMFDQAQWAARETGDEDSNPVPAFIDTTIRDVFFHRNRLGFLCGESLVMSQAGDYFNFWASSARAVLDSDPIDVSASTDRVALLKHVVPFEKSLLVFADSQQFIFEGGEVLSPRSAKLAPATAFAAYGPKPVALGRNVFFATYRGDYTNIREYYYDGGSTTNDAADLTLHCPSYIPLSASNIVPCAAEDMVFLQLADRDGVSYRHTLYVYNSYWNGEEKSQSAWHKWQFHEDDKVVSIGVRGSTLRFIVQRPDGLYLDLLEVSATPYTPASYEIKLDRWISFASCTYDGTQKKSFWTLPYAVPEGVEVRVITTKRTGDLGQGLIADRIGPQTFAVSGDYRNTEVVVGQAYDSWVRLSRQYLSDAQDAPIINDRVQIRDLVVSFSQTGYFEAVVTPDGRDPRTYIFSGKQLGLTGMLVGVEVMDKGSYKIPVMARNSEVDIELHNDSHLPCRFISAEWQGHISMQASRR